MAQQTNLKNKKIVMVIAPNNFRDEEYLEPREILENQGAQITVASLRTGESIGKNGARAKIDALVSDINPADFDAVIFVGGSGMVDLVSRPEMTQLAQRFYQAGKLTTAICIAPAILAYSGILAGKTATVWSGAKDILKKAGAKYTGRAVEVGGKIITANGPAAAKEFGEAIARNL
jgi:protease I